MFSEPWCAGLLLCCQVLTAKRAEIIAAIGEVQGAVAEDAWLEDYEADEGRYKVSAGAACTACNRLPWLPAGVASHACCMSAAKRVFGLDSLPA
jgi:hypothetical protein